MQTAVAENKQNKKHKMADAYKNLEIFKKQEKKQQKIIAYVKKPRQELKNDHIKKC